MLVTYEDTQHHKPHPAPLLVASQRAGIEPAGMLYVGDAVVDIQAGKAAGTRTAGVTWGASARPILAGAHPDYIFDTMEELARAIVGEEKHTASGLCETRS